VNGHFVMSALMGGVVVIECWVSASCGGHLCSCSKDGLSIRLRQECAPQERVREAKRPAGSTQAAFLVFSQMMR
jgi:hypothetical protein